MTRFIDISVPIMTSPGLVPMKESEHQATGPHAAYKPGELSVTISQVFSWDMPTAKAMLSRMNGPVHTGTHVDAPLHRYPKGRSIDQMPLDTFYGDVYIVDVSHKVQSRQVTAADLQRALPKKGKVERLLIRSGWYKTLGTPRFDSSEAPYLTPEAGDWIISRGVKLLALDFRTQPAEDNPTETDNHRKLLTAGVCLITNLANLNEIKKKKAIICAFPLKFASIESGMTRAVIIE